MMVDNSGDTPEAERDEIASRMRKRGYNSDIVYKLTQEGLSELERRLDENESREKIKDMNDFIRRLFWKKKKQLPLKTDDLLRDPERVKKMKSKRLERESEELAEACTFLENQIKSVMGYEDGDDQLANLNKDKARIEKKLKQNQEEINLLRKQ